ncbi:DUF418 domain-containing protein [Nocardiopsis alba]|uniref:DUF418 domain-containing protein n=1 Tax=Nocardiopsis alba TaxID=53437 RepID=UPI0034006F83
MPQRPRLLAPDFARGAMLLLIVLSNSAIFLYGGTHERSVNFPDPTTGADSLTQFLMIALLDVRTYPLFAFLVGYGLMRAFEGGMDRGSSPDEAMATVQSRNRWLIVFGFVHAALLLGSEVLAAYGIIGLVLCSLFLRGGERRSRVAIAVGVGLLGLVFVLASVALVSILVLDPAGPSPAIPQDEFGGLNGGGLDDYLASVVVRLMSWSVLLLVNAFGVVLPTAILIGLWAARHRVIEEPERHRRLLRSVAFGGIALGLTGSLPGALHHVGAFQAAPFHGLTDAALTAMAWTTGLAQGLGYAALFVLVSSRFEARERVPMVITSVAALGRRSLSGYLTHSIVMAPVLSAWGLGLAGDLTNSGMALFAIGLWLSTVVAATLMERHGIQGPFERLLRHLSSRRSRKNHGNTSPEPEGTRLDR